MILRIRVAARTAWMGACAAVCVAVLLGPQGGRAQSRSAFVHHRHLQVRAWDGSWQRALVMFPRRNDRQDHPEGERYPLVVALHGRGEAARGPSRGFLGWSVDYGLPDAFGALVQENPTELAYRGFVDRAHLDAVNAELDVRPFEGCMVVTPYVPDLLAPDSKEELGRYGEWLAGPLLEQVREQFDGAARSRDSTGIDGVSLGGMVALETGLRHPDAFGAVGAIQPAIDATRARALAQRAAEVWSSGHRQDMRLLTTTEDPFRAATRHLSDHLRERSVPHRLLELPGPHDYEFNRGAGGVELLRFHGQVLARERYEP